MADPWHVKWLSEGVRRWNTRRRKVDFTPDLAGIKFFGLLPPDFRDAPKTSRYFERINLSRANLAGADLSGLNFRGAKFDAADLTNSDMSMSNFDEAKFLGADLSGATLYRSFFSGAVFDRTRLVGTSFEDVNLVGATFVSLDLDKSQRAAADVQAARIIPDAISHRPQISAGNMSASGVVLPPLHADANREARKPKNKYDVYFATNRAAVIQRGELVGFDGNSCTDVSYGVCEVIVPEGRRLGSLGSRIWKRLWSRIDDRLRLDTMIGLNEELFWCLLRETSSKMKVKARPTIFVHGFNNTFEQAVLRAAQIGYDLGLGQGIGLFSWPSKGGLGTYSADEASSEASKYALADFIESFIDQSPQKSANIIAHSMGCRSVIGAIEVLSSKRTRVIKCLNQVILAAADVDTAIMPNIGKHVVKHSARTTSYVSDRDTALKISGWLHSFPRVGITPPTFVLEGMDTILVNRTDLGDFGHSYVGSSRSVLADIFALLKTNSPPEERHAIERAFAAGSAYWRIRD